jgi:Protein trafficking PGA2
MEALLESISSFFDRCLSLLQRQFQRTYDELDTRQFLQICAVIVGYLVVRPFFFKLFGVGLNSSSEKDRPRKTKKTKAAVPNKTSPNTLRYGPLSQEVEVSDDTASDDSDAKPVTEEDKKDQKTRRRQRRVLRAKLDEDEMRKLEDDEWNDPDIADLMPPPQNS